MDLPYSAACERNQTPILQVISPYLKNARTVLEVGSGTAQHAVFFAQANPQLVWQTADQQHYLDGIHARLATANLENVLLPIELDVNRSDWNTVKQKFDLIYTANTLHIMSAQEVQAFFKGLPEISDSQSLLIIYGPFKYGGQFTSEGNQAFDQSLRSRDVGSCIKDFEEIESLAKQQGFELVLDQAMPANNQCLVWQRSINIE